MPKFQFDVIMQCNPHLQPLGYASEIANIITDAAAQRVKLLGFINDCGNGYPCFTLEGALADVGKWARAHYDEGMSDEDLEEANMMTD